jgi:predicted HicB family RNase H-like nuclease
MNKRDERVLGGWISLKVFLDACREDDVELFKSFSGKFVLQIPPEDHAAISIAASASGNGVFVIEFV